MDAVVVGRQPFDLGGNARGIARHRIAGNRKHVVFTGGGNPGTALEGSRHAVYLAGSDE
ncbi:hypothetical protein D9M69_685340 [compost metagenome]